MGPNITRTAQFICEEGLIAIVRGDFPAAKLLEIGDGLLASPVVVMAVTLSSPCALDAIALLRQRLGQHVLVGAGTVRTVDQFDQAVAAGAQFTTSPNLDLPTVRGAQAADILHLPGVFTPTEVQMARAAGCRLVKLFPSDVVGPRYLKALRAPLNNIGFVPAGGITADNVGDYIRAGAVAVGLGGALVTNPDQPMDDLISRARTIRNAWKEAVIAKH